MQWNGEDSSVSIRGYTTQLERKEIRNNGICFPHFYDRKNERPCLGHSSSAACAAVFRKSPPCSYFTAGMSWRASVIAAQTSVHRHCGILLFVANEIAF